MRLFELAKERPDGCVLFFDEIDGLCRKRSESEDETTRRVKNELLKQLDGKLACQLCTNEHTYAPHYAQYSKQKTAHLIQVQLLTLCIEHLPHENRHRV